jgi:hypothetical protein
MIKKYYIIEPLDIDGDTNPDGVLISQYKLDKYNNKIFLKNKYITFEKINTYIKKGGYSSYYSNKRHQQHHPYHLEQKQNLIVLTPDEYNAYMNNKIKPQQLLNQYPPQYHHQYPPQYPPQYHHQQPIILKNNHNGSFGNAFMSGVGGGAGFGISTAIIDALFGE